MNVSGHVVKVKLIIFFLNLHIGYLNEVDNDNRFSGHVIKVNRGSESTAGGQKVPQIQMKFPLD